MAEEAKWHISANGFTNVHAEWGLVGGKPDEPISTFYLHSDDAGSSQFPHSPESHVTRTKWQPIETPTLSLGAEWRKRFGKMPCDLLKIDVEGSEGALLHDEVDFLDNVRRIVIEVHHWLVDVAALERLLREKGFELETKTPSGDADVRIYRNRNFAAAA